MAARDRRVICIHETLFHSLKNVLEIYPLCPQNSQHIKNRQVLSLFVSASIILFNGIESDLHTDDL